MRGYPPRFMPLLMSVAGLLLLSGLLLTPTMLDLRLMWSVPWRLPEGSRTGVAALHVAAAFAATLLLGALWSIHVRAGWRMRRNHRNGALLTVILLALAATGVGLFYLSGEMTAVINSAAHVALGLLLPICFVCHMVMGRRQRRRRLQVQYRHAARHDIETHSLGRRNFYRSRFAFGSQSIVT